MPKLTVTTQKNTRELVLKPGECVLNCLERHAIALENPCHGKGTCGKCRFKVLRGEAPEKSPAEKAFNLKERLACLVYPATDLAISLPEQSQMRFLEEDYRGLLDKLDSPSDTLVVFCDIGTTSVQLLIATGDGRLLDRRSFLNPQKAYGLDVLTRISHTAGAPDNLTTLTKLIRTSVSEELENSFECLGLSPQNLRDLYVVGNPTMIHLFFGVSPESLGRAPYALAMQDSVEAPLATFFEGTAFENATVRSYPLASAYIGSDVLAGAVYCRLREARQPELLVDIGTNGELILAADGKLYAASCATGPALEGMNLSCGMRAENGAIEDVRLDATSGQVHLSVIGDTAPVGLCGSGILAVVKEGLRLGLITTRGRLQAADRLSETDPHRAFLTDIGGRPALKLTEDLTVTLKDVRQVQLAKTALLAGINALLERAGLTPSDLNAVYIAGQFGYHLNPDVLLNCGLLPEVPSRALRYLGNTALKGMIVAAADPERHQAFLNVRDHLETVYLSQLDHYDRYFIEASSFPEFKEVNHD